MSSSANKNQDLQRLAGQSQPPDEARIGADHLRLKVKIYPRHQPTLVEVAQICRRLRAFCDEAFSLAHPSAVDVMEGFGMGHADSLDVRGAKRI